VDPYFLYWLVLWAIMGGAGILFVLRERRQARLPRRR
jgi:hypothetical protein